MNPPTPTQDEPTQDEPTQDEPTRDAPTQDGGYAAARVAYDGPGLREEDLAPTPLAQFERWYAEAAAAGVTEPNAMVLSTVDADGVPTSRTVLLKQADARGLAFYTNHGSRKAGQMAQVPQVAALFPWYPLQRQVALHGRVERLGEAETTAYFTARPWGSRIGAWASRQSEPLADRGALQARWAELAARWPDRGRPDDVPLPEHWGGYLLRPVEVEFWQGRPSRLHDRLVYLAQRPSALDDAAAWRVVRRQP